MPYIDCKVSKKLDGAQMDEIKSKLGKAVGIIGKPEFYLMVGIEDGYTLYMGGNKPDAAAFVSVSLFGKSSSSNYEKMTAEICNIFKAYGIDGKNVYVTYSEVPNWGWNG
ncbi:MAG: hypothetical protein LUD47_02255, partial [Clostridia bacterium]|nr:hypothetical protein [Clostridia bacterium]